MKHIFLLFLILCTSLSANYSIMTEGEPSSLVEGIASVITRELYLSEEDIVIEGAEPLRLKRNHIGIGREHVIFPHLFADFNVKGRMIQISEPNGTLLTYVHRPIEEHKKKHKHVKHYIFEL